MKSNDCKFKVSGQNAFTLVEILVVLSVIALLAAILFPAFSSSREKSRISSCLSNVRQIGVAILAYRQDFDERFPVATDNNDHGVYLWESGEPKIREALSESPPLGSALSAYIKDNQIWRCPSDVGGKKILNRNADNYDTIVYNSSNEFYSMFGTSYVYRVELGFVETSEDAKAVDFGEKSLSISDIVMLADGSNWHMASRPNAVSTYLFGADEITGYRNMLYADGHVKTTPEKTFFLLWLGNLGVQ